MRTVETFITWVSPEVVWNILADVEHWRDWTPTVIDIKPLDGTGLKVGARFRVLQPKLRPSIYEVTECVPNRRFTWVQKFVGSVMIAEHQIAASDGVTRVELSFASQGLMANIVANLTSGMIRNYVAIEARSLKKLCDNLVLDNEA